MSARADATILRFGQELNAWCLSSSRVTQTSTLYDLPGRSTVGFAFSYAVAPELVRTLDAAIPRELLGQRLRAPLMRPAGLQALIVIEGWLMGRERLIIDAGERLPDSIDPAADRADWDLIGSWYADVVGAMRGEEPFPPLPTGPDGRPVPGETVRSQPLLEDGDWDALTGEPLAEAEAQRVRRAFGAIDLFALTLHGEQRDGLFDRGPHRAADGFALTLHEVTDLDNRFLPWAGPDSRLGVDAVGVVNAHRPETEVRVDMWGTVGTSSGAPPDQVRGVWSRRGDELRPLAIDELEAIAARANEAVAALFTRMATWDDDYRTAYGGPLFANLLAPFLRVAGVEGAEEGLLRRSEEIAAAELPRLKGAAAHPIWARLARTDGEVVYTTPDALSSNQPIGSQREGRDG